MIEYIYTELLIYYLKITNKINKEKGIELISLDDFYENIIRLESEGKRKELAKYKNKTKMCLEFSEDNYKELTTVLLKYLKQINNSSHFLYDLVKLNVDDPLFQKWKKILDATGEGLGCNLSLLHCTLNYQKSDIKNFIYYIHANSLFLYDFVNDIVVKPVYFHADLYIDNDYNLYHKENNSYYLIYNDDIKYKKIDIDEANIMALDNFLDINALDFLKMYVYGIENIPYLVRAIKIELNRIPEENAMIEETIDIFIDSVCKKSGIDDKSLKFDLYKTLRNQYVFFGNYFSLGRLAKGFHQIGYPEQIKDNPLFNGLKMRACINAHKSYIYQNDECIYYKEHEDVKRYCNEQISDIMTTIMVENINIMNKIHDDSNHDKLSIQKFIAEYNRYKSANEDIARIYKAKNISRIYYSSDDLEELKKLIKDVINKVDIFDEKCGNCSSFLFQYLKEYKKSLKDNDDMSIVEKWLFLGDNFENRFGILDSLDVDCKVDPSWGFSAEYNKKRCYEYRFGSKEYETEDRDIYSGNSLNVILSNLEFDYLIQDVYTNQELYNLGLYIRDISLSDLNRNAAKIAYERIQKCIIASVHPDEENFIKYMMFLIFKNFDSSAYNSHISYYDIKLHATKFGYLLNEDDDFNILIDYNKNTIDIKERSYYK